MTSTPSVTKCWPPPSWSDNSNTGHSAPPAAVRRLWWSWISSSVPLTVTGFPGLLISRGRTPGWRTWGYHRNWRFKNAFFWSQLCNHYNNTKTITKKKNLSLILSLFIIICLTVFSLLRPCRWLSVHHHIRLYSHHKTHRQWQKLSSATKDGPP